MRARSRPPASRKAVAKKVRQSGQEGVIELSSRLSARPTANIFNTARKERKMDSAERQEMESLIDTYMHAVGFDHTPLGMAANG